jgi:DNA (cytosine-5)-methyltransferase 1
MPRPRKRLRRRAPLLLDAYCGQGGASEGYYRAGFNVVGVDNKPQPNYPFEFHQGDAVEFIKEHGHEFDAIAASPPCQAGAGGVGRALGDRERGRGTAVEPDPVVW